ncbi:MAG: hypothetical protein HGA85_05380 [Nanoarchaeota archaeon]|nr:hypothetical protein [Nanoarchaeota archaeon]
MRKTIAIFLLFLVIGCKMASETINVDVNKGTPLNLKIEAVKESKSVVTVTAIVTTSVDTQSLNLKVLLPKEVEIVGADPDLSGVKVVSGNTFKNSFKVSAKGDEFATIIISAAEMNGTSILFGDTEVLTFYVSEGKIYLSPEEE